MLRISIIFAESTGSNQKMLRASIILCAFLLLPADDRENDGLLQHL